MFKSILVPYTCSIQQAHSGNRRRAHQRKDSAEMPTRIERRRPRADPRGPSTALAGTPRLMLGNMKNRFNEETNGGKSRGVVMIYFSCEPGRTYGVVLISFYGW
jgi:hypothetical protein